MKKIVTRREGGFTLIEIVVAMMIAAVVLVTFMAAVTYSVRATAANKAHFQAMQVANYYAGLLAAADFGKLGHYDLESDEFEAVFMHNESNPLEVVADPENPERSVKVKIWFDFAGWGSIASSTKNSMTVDLPQGTGTWTANEWAGDYVTIIEPSGLSYVLRIVSNGASNMTITKDLTGEDQVDLDGPVDDDSTFIINNGKRVRMTATWGNGEGYRRIERELVIRRLTQSEEM